MTLFTKESLKELEEKISLIDVLDSFGADPYHTTTTVVDCPYCGSDDLRISKDESHYYCFDCNAQGNSIDYLMNVNKMTFVESIEALADMYNVELDIVPSKEPIKKFEGAVNKMPLSFWSVVKDIENPLIVHAFVLCAAMIDSVNKVDVFEGKDVKKEKKEKKSPAKVKRTAKKPKKKPKSS